MATKIRLDAELVKRRLARSRLEARELIAEGVITVNGVMATKAATQVDPAWAIEHTGPKTRQWASRGAHKLIGALDYLQPLGCDVVGKRVLDAGAAHGGFTEVLLERGAREVIAVDVGYGQLDWKLRTDERVKVYDRTNIRYCSAADFAGPCDVIVSDLSFISLSVVLPAFMACLKPEGDIIPMVKPQFEVGKERVGKNGVVKDSTVRADAVAGVVREALKLGLDCREVVASPLPGPQGNVEYFLWLHSSPSLVVREFTAADQEKITQAIAAGPQ